MNNVRLIISARGVGDVHHDIEVIALLDGRRRAVGAQRDFSRYQFKTAIQDTYPDAQVEVRALGDDWIADIEVSNG